jgi:hypothetical protein
VRWVAAAGWPACWRSAVGSERVERARGSHVGRTEDREDTGSESDRLSLSRSSRSIVCRQKPQKENSGGKFGWGKIQPLLKAGAGLID